MPGPNKSFSDIDADSVDATTVTGDTVDATNTTTDTLNGADILNMAAGEILESDGAGNLQPTAAPSGGSGLWTEDGNSPINVTNVASHTYTLAGTYDLVLIMVQALKNEDAATQEIGIQLDGQAGSGYEYVDNADNLTQSAGSIPIDTFSAGNQVAGRILITGTWDFRPTVYPRVLQTRSISTVVGDVQSVTSPLDTFTFVSGGNISVKARVYGWSGNL